MERLERFYRIQSLLRSRRNVRTQEFLAALEVSRATFKRDLEYLRDRFGAPIIYDKDQEAYRLDEKVADDPVWQLARPQSRGSVHLSRRYSGLSQYGEFLDSIVRAHKTGGQNSALAVLDAEKSNDHRIRSIAHSFYLALGVTTKSWKSRERRRNTDRT